MSIYHPLDITGKAGDDGKRAELSFADRFYKKYGVKLQKTDSYRDCVEHVDYDGAFTGKHQGDSLKNEKKIQRVLRQCIKESDYGRK